MILPTRIALGDIEGEPTEGPDLHVFGTPSTWADPWSRTVAQHFDEMTMTCAMTVAELATDHMQSLRAQSAVRHANANLGVLAHRKGREPERFSGGEFSARRH